MDSDPQSAHRSWAYLVYLALSSGIAIAAIAGFAWWTDGTRGPADRAVAVSVEGCGFATDEQGSGVAFGGNRVITAAHVVAQADTITATVDGEELTARIVAWDAELDLAVLAVDGLSRPPIAWGALDVGDTGTLIRSEGDPIEAEVLDWVELSIEEVLGTERHARLGYRLGVEAGRGDSGSGIFDADGRLVAVLFATEPAQPIGWATAASEIEPWIDQPDSVFRCEPDLSRIVGA